MENNVQEGNKRLGIASFVLGLLSLVLAILMPKFCLICAIVSIIFSVISKKGSLATAGMVLGIIGAVISFMFVCIEMDIGNGIDDSINNSEIVLEENNVKYYEIPKWMKNEPKTMKDKERVNDIISKYEEKYNVNFNYIGCSYSEVEKNVYEVSTVYAFSDEYPEVYTCLRVNPDNDGGYIQDINGWKGRNYIYDTAEKLGIDTNLIGSDVCWGFSDEDNEIFCDILINKKVTLDSMKSLAEEVRKSLNKDKVKFTIYQVDSGSNKEYKEFINKYVFINTNYLLNSFGSWYEYDIISNKSETTCELMYSRVK